MKLLLYPLAFALASLASAQTAPAAATPSAPATSAPAAAATAAAAESAAPAAPAAAETPAPLSLDQVKTVYVLPMRHGFDQYLADELTRHGVLQVVADPKHADAVLTDHLGEGFEQKLSDILPKPPKPEVSKADADKKKGTNDMGDAFAESRPPASTLGMARGNVFLVDAHSRAVLWSTFRTTKNTRPKEMKRTADQVTGDLNRALHPKAEKPGS